jgi:tetratricopeptide (TPR) repeat protein
VTANRIAVENATAAGQRQGRAWALQSLGQALARLGDEEGIARVEEALAIRREIGDPAGEALTEIGLAGAYNRARGPVAAISHSVHSLELLRRIDNPALLGTALINHSEFCLELGRLDEATKCAQEALDIWTAIGGHGRGYAMHIIGRIHLESGRLSEAIAALAESHRLHTASGDLQGQAETLKYLAEAQRRAGLQDQARESLAAALVLFESLEATREIEAIHSALVRV